MNQQKESNPRRILGKQAQFPGGFSYQVLGLFVCFIVFAPRHNMPERGLTQADPITFGQTQFENNFPAGLTFEVTIASRTAEINAVTLVHGLQGDTSLFQEQKKETNQRVEPFMRLA